VTLEIRVLLEPGADEGVFEGAKHEMVTHVLRNEPEDDRTVMMVRFTSARSSTPGSR
jgi:hypothetical protein